MQSLFLLLHITSLGLASYLDYLYQFSNRNDCIGFIALYDFLLLDLFAKTYHNISVLSALCICFNSV